MDLTTCIMMVNRLTMKKEGVCLPQDTLRKALKQDQRTAGRLPTEAEVWSMVDHNDEDEDKETPADVRASFPKTTEEVESAWQLR